MIHCPRVVLVHARMCGSARTCGSACTCMPAQTLTFNVDKHFHLEMIVNINVIILERDRGLPDRYRV